MVQISSMNSKPFNTKNASIYWKAVLDRDTYQDGLFVYAVKSTNIFCKPSCPSKRPNRNQVLFFQSPQEASKAGFRPCKRCKPTQPALQQQMVFKICRYIESHLEDKLDLKQLSGHINLSPAHFQKVFLRVTGISPKEFIDITRFHEFKRQLAQNQNITQSLYAAGYGSNSRLYERSNSLLGMTPSSYKRGGRKSLIQYTITASPLGKMLLATTNKGICSVNFGDNDSILENLLHKEFPSAIIQKNHQDLKILTNLIVSHLKSMKPYPDFPLDIQATLFQRKIWNILQTIPFGETKTYSDIAQSIGNPRSVRAVARACATNPTALLIPCHRVIRKNGDLAGYRWGLKRKQSLLKLEQKK